ncbi:hypothetical protein AVEN_148591-1, partial [Araneus ventricosus]
MKAYDAVDLILNAQLHSPPFSVQNRKVSFPVYILYGGKPLTVR